MSRPILNLLILILIATFGVGLLAGCTAMATQPPGAVQAREQPPAAMSPANAPVWKPGYEWVFRWEAPRGTGTFVWTVNREEIVDGVAYYVLTTGWEREKYVRKADLADYLDKVRGEIEGRNIPPHLRYMWPLALGKTWEATFTRELPPRDRKTNEVALQCQVEAEETITVPAGTFRTFKIVWRYQGTGSISTETWYAPEVKQWIRERAHFPSGILERELISFKSE